MQKTDQKLEVAKVNIHIIDIIRAFLTGLTLILFSVLNCLFRCFCAEDEVDSIRRQAMSHSKAQRLRWDSGRAFSSSDETWFLFHSLALGPRRLSFPCFLQ